MIRGEGLDEKQLYDLTYNVIQPQLERLPGIASATVSGGKQREIEVKVDRDQLRARDLGILDVVNAVKGANLLLPSGNLRAGEIDYNVFTNTQVDTVRRLEGVVVRQGAATTAGTMGQSTSSVRVGDVAKVVDGTADQANVVRVNGTRGVYLRVLKQPGANTIAVVDAVRAALPNLRGIPPNVKCEISFDQSTYIRAAVSALEHEAVQGGLLAVVVILVFLVSFRATGIVAVAIPMSIIATFILLYFFDQTLNVFTLGGLALGVGRLVDDSIVELENIHRHLQFTSDRRKAVLDAAQEVAMPILVSHDHHGHRVLPGALPRRRREEPLPAARDDHHLRAHDELLRLAHRDSPPLPLVARRRARGGGLRALRSPASSTASTMPTLASLSVVLRQPRPRDRPDHRRSSSRRSACSV